MADYGIKISKVGKKTTSTNLFDYNLWSKNPVGKIAKEEGGSIASGNTKVVDYSAEAGTNSVWIPYVSDDNTNWYIGGLGQTNGIGYAVIDADNFSIDLHGVGGGTDYWYYFVIVDAFK